MQKKQVTLKGMAGILGVSHTTVSRALKDHPDISKEMKLKVRELAEHLHYLPNKLAINLRKNRTNNIGVVIPEISNYFFPSVLRGIEDIFQNKGFYVLIMQTNESFEREKEMVEILLGNRVAGLLVSVTSETRNYHHFENVEEAGIPVVYFDKVINSQDAFKVEIDGEKDAFKGTMHLIESGFENIVMIAGTPNMSISEKRINGFKTAMIQAGKTFDSQNVMHAGTTDEAEFFTQQAMGRTNPPDAIFTISDQNLEGALKAIHRLKIRIPDDVALLTFSDGPLTEISNPTISCIRHSGYLVGSKAANLLYNRIQNSEAKLIPIAQTIKTELIIRESTKKK
jgi:DNA-binding LacI/PurR family transcriptional regulator